MLCAARTYGGGGPKIGRGGPIFRLKQYHATKQA